MRTAISASAMVLRERIEHQTFAKICILSNKIQKTGTDYNYILSERSGNMQNYLRFAALTIVFLFVGSLMVGFVSNSDAPESEVLAEEPVIQNPSQASSPGHVVFGQYISSDNCGHCSKPGGGSDAHHSIKQNHPDDYVYITYMSASYGDTDLSLIHI